MHQEEVRMGKFQTAKIEQERLEITAAAKFKIIHKSSMLRIFIMYMCASTGVLSTCTSIVLV